MNWTNPTEVRGYMRARRAMIKAGTWASRLKAQRQLEMHNPDARRAYHRAKYRELGVGGARRIEQRIQRVLRAYVPYVAGYDATYQRRYHHDRYLNDPEFRERKRAALARFRAKKAKEKQIIADPN